MNQIHFINTRNWKQLQEIWNFKFAQHNKGMWGASSLWLLSESLSPDLNAFISILESEHAKSAAKIFLRQLRSSDRKGLTRPRFPKSFNFDSLVCLQFVMTDILSLPSELEFFSV